MNKIHKRGVKMNVEKLRYWKRSFQESCWDFSNFPLGKSAGVFLIFIVILSQIVFAVVNHPAAQVTNGTFAVGNFRFQNNLTVDTSTFHVDGTNNRVGVGINNPQSAFHVVGPIRIGDFQSCTALETDAEGDVVCGVDEVGDADPANEIQTLGTSGNQITLSSGGSVIAPYALVAGNANTVDGFNLNGRRRSYKTDNEGQFFLTRADVNEPLDLSIALDSLEDPFWASRKKGVRVIPRKGQVTSVSFPVFMTGEIDGTAYIIEGEQKRHVSDVEIQLVDSKGNVIKSEKSEYDGFYVISNIVPGNYYLRVSAAQATRLGVRQLEEKMIVITNDNLVLNGIDLLLSRKE